MEKVVKTIKATVTATATDIFATVVPLGTIRHILSVTFAGVATADVVTLGNYTVNIGVDANVQLPLVESEKPLFDILGGSNVQLSDAGGQPIIATVKYEDDITV